MTPIEKIAEHYGLNSQLLKLAEEAAEVAQAALKYQRTLSQGAFEHLCEELADFEIVHEQVKLLHSEISEQEQLYKQFKIEREIHRLKMETEE